MARNMNKTLERYNKKFGNLKCSRSTHFTVGEIEQIAERTDFKFEAVALGLEAGFILGYQFAKKEAKQQ